MPAQRRSASAQLDAALSRLRLERRRVLVAAQHHDRARAPVAQVGPPLPGFGQPRLRRRAGRHQLRHGEPQRHVRRNAFGRQDAHRLDALRRARQLHHDVRPRDVDTPRLCQHRRQVGQIARVHLAADLPAPAVRRLKDGHQHIGAACRHLDVGPPHRLARIQIAHHLVLGCQPLGPHRRVLLQYLPGERLIRGRAVEQAVGGEEGLAVRAGDEVEQPGSAVIPSRAGQPVGVDQR